MIDRIMYSLVVTQCLVFHSLDLVHISELIMDLLGVSEEADLLQPFMVTALQETVHFRLHLKRPNDTSSRPRTWYLPSPGASPFLGIRYLQLQCDRIVAHEREMWPITFCELHSLRNSFPNLWNLTLHVTLYLRGSETTEVFYEQISRLLDIVKRSALERRSLSVGGSRKFRVILRTYRS